MMAFGAAHVCKEIFILALLQSGSRTAHKIIGIRAQVLAVAEPPNIVKLVPGGTSYGAAQRSPGFYAEKLRDYPIRFFVQRVIIMLKVLTDHPPAVVVDFVNCIVRADKERNISPQKTEVVRPVERAI